MLTYAGAMYDQDGEADVAVLGMPSDMGADTTAGQGNGPGHLRYYAVMPPGIFPYTPFEGTIIDVGDAVPTTRNNDEYMAELERNVAEVANKSELVLGLGGDDSVNYGMVAGLVEEHGDIGVVHLDAHTDTEMSDNPGIDHSNWVRHAHSLAPFQQWGCREMSDTEPLTDTFAEDLPLFIAIDMDVFDPAFAPGVAVPVPFGPPPFTVLDAITSRLVGHPIIGISITEIVPARDLGGQTATLACYLVNRILASL